MRHILSLLLATLLLCACMPGVLAEADLLGELGLNAQSKPASEHTAVINSAVYSQLDLGTRRRPNLPCAG